MANVIYTKGIDVTSATLSDLGAGLTSSVIRTEPDGKRYRLFKNDAATTIAVKSLVEIKALGTDNVATVILAATTTKQPCGNTQATYNGTGTTITDQHYFWAQVSGIGTCTAGTTTTVSLPVFAHATDGSVSTTQISTNMAVGIALATASSGDVAVLLNIA